MPQDKESGATAAKWGRDTARQLIEKLGAKPLSNISNEALLDDELIVVKCAKANTDTVGVTFIMLARVSRVFGAFQQSDGSFDIWSLPSSIYSKHTRESVGRGTSAGKYGLVRRDTFHSLGNHIGIVRLP